MEAPIPLDSPLWSRLYGPYGVNDVPAILAQLQAHWDIAVATDLFWEKLHHQETLYPVTYAALPWIWKLRPKSGDEALKTLQFLSWAIYCALRNSTGVANASDLHLVGLSQDLRDHQHTWLKPDERLRSEDMAALADLKVDFLTTMSTICVACEVAASDTNDSDAAYLLVGPSMSKGAPGLAFAMTLFADGEDFDAIDEEAPAADDPSSIAADIAATLGPKASALRDFLLRRATE